MTHEDFFESLIGKSKHEVRNLLNAPRTPFESNEWVYQIGKNYFGLNRRLYLFFSDDLVYDFFTSSWA